MKSEVYELESKFKRFFSNRDYVIDKNDSILTEDPTILFVNSTMVSYKDRMINQEFIEKTAKIQDCFRMNSDDESLILFKMLGIIADAKELETCVKDFLDFLVVCCEIPRDRLIVAIHHEDKRLINSCEGIINQKNIYLIDENSEMFSTRWTYGDVYDLKGKGLTIIYNDNLDYCSPSCDINCSCNKFRQIGNFIVINKGDSDRSYLDFGFGLERTLSYKYNGDLFKIKDFKFYIDKIIELGYSYKRSKSIFNNMNSIIRLVSEKVTPSSKKTGYILRRLIRMLVNGFLEEGATLSEVEEKYLEVYKLFDYTSEEYCNNVVLEEIELYLKNLKKSIESSKKFIRKNKLLSQSELIEKIKDTFGVPEVLTKKMLSYKKQNSNIDIEFIKRSFESDREIKLYLDSVDNIGLWNSEKVIFQQYINKSDKILDLGCGAGRVTFGLYKLGYKNIVGIDISSKMLDCARDISLNSNMNIRFIEDDATSLNIKEKFNCVIFSFNGLMMIHGKELRKKAVLNIKNILVDDGYFIFTTLDREINTQKYGSFWTDEKMLYLESKDNILEYGDIIYKNEDKIKQFMHIPNKSEIEKLISECGLELVFCQERKKMCEENKDILDFSENCLFWVAKN